MVGWEVIHLELGGFLLTDTYKIQKATIPTCARGVDETYSNDV